jgi:hypothetical protein
MAIPSQDLENVLETSSVALCNCGQIRFERAAILTAEAKQMLQTIAIVLIVLWLLGMVTSYTMSGFIHILLVLAVVSILIRLIQGRSVA